MRGCSCRGTAGFAHVSCLAEQAKILFAEAVENNLDLKVKNARWKRWSTCSLCEQRYHGVVACALGWACWKTCIGRPEGKWARFAAMSVLGNGLDAANQHEDALSVREAELSMLRRVGAREENILAAQSGLANTYQKLGRHERALEMYRHLYSVTLRLEGEEHKSTLVDAFNYAHCLITLKRYAEAKALLRKIAPVARRVLGDSHELTLRVQTNYALSLYEDPAATLDDLRESVATFEETARIARRVLGGTHPLTLAIEGDLLESRAALREAPHS